MDDDGKGYWWYFVMTVDTTPEGDVVNLYKNKSKLIDEPFLQIVPDDYNYLWITDCEDQTGSWDGWFDEARISKTIRNWAWINASYCNQQNPTITKGPENIITSQLDISITPNSVDFGIVDYGSENQTTGYYFNLTNNGIPCHVDIEVGNSVNWTFVNLTDRGANAFCMNFSGDDWANETNINTEGTRLVSNMPMGWAWLFDLKALMPYSSQYVGGKEEWQITLTATPS
jgi:hypothetical protein